MNIQESTIKIEPQNSNLEINEIDNDTIENYKIIVSNYIDKTHPNLKELSGIFSLKTKITDLSSQKK